MLPNRMPVQFREARSRKPGNQEDEGNGWIALQADSNRPEVQEMIRREIRRGAIRVRPLPGDANRVEIVRVSVHQSQ